MFCEMQPPVTESLARVGPHLWTLGSMMICTKIDGPETGPVDPIVSWNDGNHNYFLRRRVPSDLSRGNYEGDRVHTGGTSAAVWCLGENTFCKVHAWCEGLELEANSIRYVAEVAPEVEVPEVVYSWIDHDLKRTFLITKRVKGQVLESLWPNLSSTQRTRIARTVARFCVALAAHTSAKFETVSGFGVHEPRLMANAPHSHPTWLPRILGPFTLQAFREYMASISQEPSPEIDSIFHFYHADLDPTNILVSEDGNHVTGIIDWESAAYYPRFWLATKPMYAGAFWLECETEAVGSVARRSTHCERFRATSVDLSSLE